MSTEVTVCLHCDLRSFLRLLGGCQQQVFACSSFSCAAAPALASSCQNQAKRPITNLESSAKRLRLEAEGMPRPPRGGRASGKRPGQNVVEQLRSDSAAGAGGLFAEAAEGTTCALEQDGNVPDPGVDLFKWTESDDDLVGPSGMTETQRERREQGVADNERGLGSNGKDKETRTRSRRKEPESFASRRTTRARPDPQLNEPSAHLLATAQTDSHPIAAGTTSGQVDEDPQHCAAEASAGEDRESRGASGAADFQLLHNEPRPGRESRFYGLRNLGNTCYLNAVLQSLSGIPLFSRMMRNGRLQSPMKRISCIRALGRLLDNLGTRPAPGATWSLDAAPVKNAIGRKFTQFQSLTQQDAHELMCAFLDSVHEEVKAAAKDLFDELGPARVSPGEEQGQADVDTKEAEKFADSICPSCVTFSCTVEQRVECLRCHLVSSSLVEYNHFSIDIPLGSDLEQPFAMQALIEGYFEPERFARKCEGCMARPKAATEPEEGGSGREGEHNDTAAEGGEGKEQGHPTCCVTRKIVRLPHALVLHLKRFSVQAVKTARQRSGGSGKENMSSEGGATEWDEAPGAMDTGYMPKAAPVYDFVKKQERVTIPRVLALDAVTAAAAIGPVAPPDVGSPVRLPGKEAGLVNDLDVVEEAPGTGFADCGAGVNQGDAGVGDSFNTAPPAPPLPPPTESTRHSRGNKTLRLRRDPSREPQKSPAQERSNAVRSLHFPAPAAGGPDWRCGVRAYNGRRSDALADVTNRRGLASLLPGEDLAGEGGEKVQKRRGRQPWKPGENEMAGWASAAVVAPALQSRKVLPRSRDEQGEGAMDEAAEGEDRDGKEEPVGPLSSFARPGLRGGARASPSRSCKRAGGQRQGEAGARAGAGGRRGGRPLPEAGAVPVARGGQQEDTGDDEEVFMDASASPAGSPGSSAVETQHQQSPGARAQLSPAATHSTKAFETFYSPEGVVHCEEMGEEPGAGRALGVPGPQATSDSGLVNSAGNTLARKSPNYLYVAAITQGAGRNQQGVWMRRGITERVPWAGSERPRGDAANPVIAERSTGLEGEGQGAHEPSWSLSSIFRSSSARSGLPQAQEPRSSGSRGAQEEAAELERAIQQSKAEAEEREERQAQERAAAMSLREDQGGAAELYLSSPIPSKEQEEIEEAIRRSLLAEQERKGSAEEWEQCDDLVSQGLDNEQVRGGLGVAPVANQQGRGVAGREVGSAPCHSTAPMHDPGSHPGLADQGAGIQPRPAAAIQSTWGLQGWGWNKGWASQKECDDEAWLSLPLRERAARTHCVGLGDDCTGPIVLGFAVSVPDDGGNGAATGDHPVDGSAPQGNELQVGKATLKGEARRNRKKGMWRDGQWGPAEHVGACTMKPGAGRVEKPEGGDSAQEKQAPEGKAAPPDVQPGVGAGPEVAELSGAADSPEAAQVRSPAAVVELPDTDKTLCADESHRDGWVERTSRQEGQLQPGTQGAGAGAGESFAGVRTRSQGKQTVEEEEEEVHGKHLYALRAVVHHLGESAHHGHYVADVLDEEEGQWVHHDDSTLQRVPFSEVSSKEKSSYLMFYTRVDARPKTVQAEA